MNECADMPEFRCELNGERLDVETARLSGLTRSAVAQKIRRGEVLLDGLPARAGTKVRAGQIVSVEMPPPLPTDALPEDIPLDIVYEDGDILVLNKQKGLVVHPAPGNESGTLVNALLFHVRDLRGIGGELRPGIVHRIDKDTSGLLVVAKTAEAHETLSGQLKDHKVERVYVALVIGGFKEDAGIVDAPVARHRTDRKRMAVLPGGRQAVTEYRVLERFSGFSLLELKLHTGRTHQIRVHMQHMGHPVAGDAVYGGKCSLGLTSQALHAKELRLAHPRTGQPLHFTAPLPREFQNCLDALRKQAADSDF